MKKAILIIFLLSTSIMADNARCESLLADIRSNSSTLTNHYNNGNNTGVQQVMRESFRTATQAMFVCDDERNKDDLENILNMLGTQLGI